MDSDTIIDVSVSKKLCDCLILLTTTLKRKYMEKIICEKKYSVRGAKMLLNHMQRSFQSGLMSKPWSLFMHP